MQTLKNLEIFTFWISLVCFVIILIYCTRRKLEDMENDFKINAYFDNEGEEIEKLLAIYLSNLLDENSLMLKTN
jgi:hypothetical protein